MGSALTGFALLICVGGVAYGSFLLIFSKGRRIRGLKILVASPVLTVTAIMLISSLYDLEAEALKRAEEKRLAVEREAKDEELARAEAAKRAQEEQLAADEKKAREAADEKIKLAEEREKEQKCMTDLECWGDKNGLQASFVCDDNVPKLAKYTYEWTDGVLESNSVCFDGRMKIEAF